LNTPHKKVKLHNFNPRVVLNSAKSIKGKKGVGKKEGVKKT